MKTTLEMSDDLFRKVKATAALQGQSLKEFVTEALRQKLASRSQSAAPAWRAGFGKVPRKYVREVQAVIDAEFSKINPADWK